MIFRFIGTHAYNNQNQILIQNQNVKNNQYSNLIQLNWVSFLHFFIEHINYTILAFQTFLLNYSPISTSAALYYNISINDLFWISNMYYLVFFVFGPLFIPLLERNSAFCLKFSAIFTTIGTSVIWSQGLNQMTCLIGQFFVGVSEVLFGCSSMYNLFQTFSIYQRLDLQPMIEHQLLVFGVMQHYRDYGIIYIEKFAYFNSNCTVQAADMRFFSKLIHPLFKEQCQTIDKDIIQQFTTNLN